MRGSIAVAPRLIKHTPSGILEKTCTRWWCDLACCERPWKTRCNPGRLNMRSGPIFNPDFSLPTWSGRWRRTRRSYQYTYVWLSGPPSGQPNLL